jgi:hypothetical protein
MHRSLGRRFVVVIILVLSLIAEVLSVAPAPASAETISIPPLLSPPSQSAAGPVAGDFSPPQALPTVSPAAPQDVPPPTWQGVKGFVEGVSSEVAGLRSEDAKVFTNPDGTKTAQFASHVHYRDDAGN